MATAGSIVIDLLMKTGAFETDTARAESIAKKRAQAIDKAFSDMGAKIAIGASAAGTALTAMIVSTTNTAKEISNLAQLSGASATEFQRFAAAAKSVGVQQDQLGDMFKDFREKIGEFVSTGGGEMKDFFEQIAPKVGVTADAFRNLSGPQALQLFYDSLQKAGLSTEQMSFYLESAANDTTKLIPLLRDGGKELKTLGDEAERMGVVMDEKAIASAKELSKNLETMQSLLNGVKIAISNEVIPAINSLSQEFLIGIKHAGSFGDALRLFGTINPFRDVGGNIKAISSEIESLTAARERYVRSGSDTSSIDTALASERKRIEYLKEVQRMQALASVGSDVSDAISRRMKNVPLPGAAWKPPETGKKPAGSKGSEGNPYQFEQDGAKAWAKAMEDAANMGREATNEVNNLTRAQSALADLMGSEYWAGYSDDMKRLISDAYNQADATMQSAQATLALQAAREKEAQTALDNIASLEKQIENAQLEAVFKKDAALAIEALAIARLKEKAAVLEGFEGSEQQLDLINREIAAREKLLALGLVDKENKDDYWANWLTAAEEAMTNFDELAGSVAKNFSTQFGNAFEQMVFDSQSLGDAISNLAEGMMRSVVNAIGQMIAQWLAYKAVQLLVGETTQSAGAEAMAANAAAMVLMSGLNAFAATAAIPFVGPVLAPEAMTAAMTATAPIAAGIAALSIAGARADGGPVSQGQTYLVGERGTELFVPNTNGAIVPNNKLGGGNVTVNLIEDKSRAGKTEERTNNGVRELDVFVADIMGDGPRGKAIQRAFGLVRRGY
jgi:hypothetical protein